MKKEKLEKIIVISLITFSLIEVLYVYMNKKEAFVRCEEIPQKQVEKSEETNVEKTPAKTLELSPLVYQPVKGKDVLRHLLYVFLAEKEKIEKKENMEKREHKDAAPLPNLVITGLIWNSPKPQAIINGKVINIGDTVSGVRIIEIDVRGITVDYEGRTVLVPRV